MFSPSYPTCVETAKLGSAVGPRVRPPLPFARSGESGLPSLLCRGSGSRPVPDDLRSDEMGKGVRNSHRTSRAKTCIGIERRARFRVVVRLERQISLQWRSGLDAVRACQRPQGKRILAVTAASKPSNVTLAGVPRWTTGPRPTPSRPEHRSPRDGAGFLCHVSERRSHG